MNNDLRVQPEPEDNANFVQVSRGHIKAISALAKKSPLAHQILWILVENMGRTTNAVVCSYKALEELTGYSRRSVARGVSILKKESWIDTVKVGNATAYAVNSRIFWQAKRNQKRYAMFSASVIATESEQEQGFIEKSKQSMQYVPFLKSDERVSLGSEELPPPDQADLDLD